MDHTHSKHQTQIYSTSLSFSLICLYYILDDPGDDDSDDEFIEARQVSQNVIDEYDDGHKLLLEGIIEARNPKKPVTKADIANALIKKKIAINKKIIFDEEEEVSCKFQFEILEKTNLYIDMIRF